MTFNTGNPIGSTDARDLSDNAENFDTALGTTAATWVDRFGVTRDSFEGRLAKGSFYRVGDFTTGYTLTNMRQTLEYNGHEYSWAGTFPKVVAAGATPETSGGIGAGAWVDRSDVTLRGDLSSVDGAALVGGATYAQIRSYDGVKSRIYCLGRDHVFDQAYGMFVLDVADTTSADNDGTILVDASGRRWKRQHDGVVSIRWFGGDNTGVTLCNSALDKAKTTWSEVHFPKGTYRIEGYDLSDMSLSGEYDRGLNEAEVNFRTKIVGSGDIFTNANNFTIDGIYFKNVGSLGKIISVADMDTQIGTISNCFFGTANYHIFHQSATKTIVGSSIQNCKFQHAQICSRWYDNAGLYQYSEEQCYTQANAIGVMFRSSSSAVFSASVFEFNTDVAVLIDNTVSYTAAIRGVSFTDIHFERNHLGSPGPHVRINVTKGQAEVEFSGGGFYVSEAPENCIDTHGCENLNLLISQTHAATVYASNGTKLIELGVATPGRSYGVNVSNCMAEFDVVGVRQQGVTGLLNTTSTIFGDFTATPILAADPLSAKLVLVSDMTTNGAAILMLTDSDVTVVSSTLVAIQWSIISGVLHGKTTGGSSFRNMAFLQLSC